MPKQLIDGLRQFKREVFPAFREHYERLVEQGQKPLTLFIGCADSRVLPDLLMNAGPGELFVLRNIGAFVPPFEPDGGFHGTSAGIEFAVVNLKVRDIIVCGHSHCGAIAAMYQDADDRTTHVTRWLDLARPAMVDEADPEQRLRRTEQRSIAVQLERLIGYPMVRQAIEAGQLSIHGWYYVIEKGVMHALDVASGEFVPLS